MIHKFLFETLSKLYTELARSHNVIALRLKQYSESKIDAQKFEADFVTENNNIGELSRKIRELLESHNIIKRSDSGHD